MKNIKWILLISVICIMTTEFSYAQVATTKKVKDKHQAYTDSLKSIDYDYVFPILGKGAYKKGFDIPYPAGVMFNAMWMKQDIVFSNFQLGYKNENNDVPLTPAEFVKFGDNSNDSQSYTLRPDLWIFPFLNIYGLIGYGASRTEVEVNIAEPISFTSIVEQEFITKGVGILAAGGVGPVWFSVDVNWTWNKPQLLDKAVRVNVMGLRMGHTFVFKNKPQSNLAVWIGGMRTKMNSATSGQITLNEAIPGDVWDRKDQFVDDYYTWKESPAFDELTPKQKVTVNTVIDPIVNAIDARNGETIVKYGMDKQTKQFWNGIIGLQYQLNKKWMFRTEGGVLGNRKSLLLSANFRFLM